MLITYLVVEIIHGNADLFYLCRPTVTLHQSQGHQDEHEQTCHAYVYRHAEFECHSLNTVRNIAIILFAVDWA